MGELAASPVNASQTFFLFHRARRIQMGTAHFWEYFPGYEGAGSIHTPVVKPAGESVRSGGTVQISPVNFPAFLRCFRGKPQAGKG